jgi:hypothetical protein
MENSPFIVDLPIKKVIFHSYVSLPEANVHDFPINHHLLMVKSQQNKVLMVQSPGV